jgi:hypothetical protein
VIAAPHVWNCKTGLFYFAVIYLFLLKIFYYKFAPLPREKSNKQDCKTAGPQDCMTFYFARMVEW